MKKLLTRGICLWMALVLLLTGCSGGNQPTDPEKGEIVVSVSVTGPEGEIFLEREEAGAFPGNTAFEATAYLLKKHKIAFSYDPATKYVKSINGAAEFDHGSGSGWLYRVNGDFSVADRSAGEFVLKDGDYVEWLYTTDMGREFGLHSED